jgi:hypothetical protein
MRNILQSTKRCFKIKASFSKRIKQAKLYYCTWLPNAPQVYLIRTFPKGNILITISLFLVMQGVRSFFVLFYSSCSLSLSYTPSNIFLTYLEALAIYIPTSKHGIQFLTDIKQILILFTLKPAHYSFY